MSAAAAESPLAALVWVFAVSFVILTALSVGALCLGFRHRRRRRNGIYARILEAAPSSRVSNVLTVGDLLMDELLRNQIQRPQIKEAQASQLRVSTSPANLRQPSD